MKAKMLGVLALAVFLFIGCSGREGVKLDKQTIKALNLEGAPSWVLNGGQGDMSAVGIANIVDNDLAYARSEALALARDELARQVETEVEGVFTRMQSMESESMQKVSKQIISQSVSQTLSGTKQADLWVSKDTTRLFILVQLTPELKAKLQANVKKKIDKSSLPSQLKQEAKKSVDMNFTLTKSE